MPIRSVSLTEATADQRLEYVRSFLNLPLSAIDDDRSISAKILQAQPGIQTIFVNEPDQPEDVSALETAGEPVLREEEQAGKQAGTLGQGDPRARIMIPVVDTQDGTGARDVLVGVNGRAWQLKRGADLDVPWRVVEALKNASTHVITHSTDADTLGEVNTRVAQRFAFQLLSGPSQAEIDDWLERTSRQFCG